MSRCSVRRTKPNSIRFVDDYQSETYYATYTAYNGRFILPQLIETSDFLLSDTYLDGSGDTE